MSEPLPATAAAPARCLLVEPDAASAERLREIVQQAFDGIVTHHATNQAQARVMYASVRPDVVVINTNAADGAFIAEMTRRGPGVSVLVSAGHIADDRIFPALRAGAHGYLLRHDDAQALVTELRRIVEGARPLSPGLARQFLRHFSALGLRELLDDDEYRVLDGIASGATLPALGSRIGAGVEDQIRRLYEKLARSSRP